MRPLVSVLSAFLSLVLALGIFAAALGAAQAAPNDRVLVIHVDGAISVATARQLTRVLDQAKSESATAIVVRLDTPGGLVSATRDIVRDMIAAPVPIIVYVAPSGARAASAGTFIVYGSHVAAMAPGTNLGAATPIQMGGMPGAPQQKDEKKSNEPTTAERKAINDTVAWLRSLAQLRGRDLDFAEKAVREAATLTADEARKQGVVEIVATGIDDLLAQADGRKVMVAGEERTLSTRDATVMVVEPDWRTKLLAVIANPNIAFILLLVGVYGLLFEFWSPGALVPGVLGGISLLLAFIALSVLPVQYGALALLLLGIAMMTGEAFTPGIGILGLGGLVAFLVGAFFLFEPEGSTIDFGVSVPIIIGAAITSAGLTFVVIGAAMKARQRPAVIGAEEMLGANGRVMDWQGDRGNIRIHGEVWSARSERELQPGDAVRVTRREGLILTVEPE
ncbi:MAG TPA: nodulation protein NfeD [Xanthobacteraceae bacterium]|nr:nodulation protein NfeD [Xanthobacteraceae bacterium]